MTADVQLKRCRIVKSEGFTIDHITQFSLPNFSDIHSILKLKGHRISQFDTTPVFEGNNAIRHFCRLAGPNLDEQRPFWEAVQHHWIQRLRIRRLFQLSNIRIGTVRGGAVTLLALVLDHIRQVANIMSEIPASEAIAIGGF